jgi:hypothetical protein
MSAEASIPTFDDRAAMWALLDFPEHSWSHPAVDEYLAALRPRYANGSVTFHSFQMPQHPVLDWYLIRQFHDSGFFERFWSAPTPSQFYQPADPSLNYFATYGELCVFSQSSPFHLSGDLASIHFSGGAYSHSQGLGIRSKQLGEAAAHELLADDFEHVRVFASGRCWSDFFMDVAWDQTIVILSPSQRLIHCLLATDTD